MSDPYAVTRILQKLRQEVALARQVGPEEAARRTAEEVFAQVDREEIARKAEFLKERERIYTDDALAAYQMLQACYWERLEHRNPVVYTIDRAASRYIRMKFIPTAQESEERVVLKLKNANCPMVAFCDEDLTLCEQICRANFRYDIFTEPTLVLLVKSVGPRIRWEIHKFRTAPRDNCLYALVCEEETQPAG